MKKLASELRMSMKSIQRAYRKGEIPVQWLGRIARFDLTQVRRAMVRNGRRATCVVSTVTRHSRARSPAPASGAHSRPAPVW